MSKMKIVRFPSSNPTTDGERLISVAAELAAKAGLTATDNAIVLMIRNMDAEAIREAAKGKDE